MYALIVIVVSYLLGSIPFGYLIVSAKTGSDVRHTGSGGTGATNVSRRAGKAAGVATLILDALKGTAAVLFAEFMTFMIGGMDHAVWYIGIAGIAAMLGHIFPVWLGLRGGKGVATWVGVFAVIAPFALLSAAMIFVVIVLITRYVSLGSMIAALCVPVFLWIETLIRPVVGATPLIVTASVGAGLIIYAHRTNIGRLLSHTENKF